MNKYTELKSKHEKMVNDFPMGFAFSDKQFEEAKEKLGVTSNDELLSTPAGGFIRKTDSDAYGQMFRTMNQETLEMEKDDEYLYQGFLYELGNHEYGYTYDATETLACFGMDIDTLRNDERIKKIFHKAKAEYLEHFEG